MTTIAHQFIDLLKEDNILEAIGVIKQALTDKAVSEAATIKESVAQSFKLVPIAEEKDEDEEDDEDEDKEESDDEDDGDK